MNPASRDVPYKIAKSLTPERIQNVLRSDQPNLTAPGGQPFESIGPNRISTSTVNINGTQFNETVAVVHVNPGLIVKLVHKGMDGIWARCAAAVIPSIANNVARMTHLVAGKIDQVGSVYGGSPSGESWIVTGISAHSIRLVPTTNSAELGPIGILVERHPTDPKGAIVRVRGAVSNVSSEFETGNDCLSMLGCFGSLLRSCVGAGASDTASGEKRLLRQLDTCETRASTLHSAFDVYRMFAGGYTPDEVKLKPKA